MFLVWKEFKQGKTKKEDVLAFDSRLEDNIFQLREELKNKTYKHGQYSAFYVCDPKRRFINKAEVRDRLIHQAIFRVLYHIFDEKFIFDSYSCRFNKGVHVGINKLEEFVSQASKNYYYNIYALKGDVKKFFASIDKQIL